MSRREYRKLQQQQEQEAEKAKAKQLKEENGNEKENADSEDSDNENLIADAGANLGAKAKMPPHRNPFDLLNNESCSESEVKEDDDIGTESSRSHGKAGNKGDPSLSGNPQLNKKRSKKKKKRNQLLGEKSKNRKDDVETQIELDEVERSVNEVNRMLGDPDGMSSSLPLQANRRSGTRSKGSSTHQEGLALSIMVNLLNSDNEMKKMFGARVVMAEQQEQETEFRKQVGNRAVANEQRKRNIMKARRVLIPIKQHWNDGGRSGLSMSHLESDKEGNIYFVFDHNVAYQSVQQEFFLAVESMNPQRLTQILDSHPSHIDSLLQLSEVCKMGEDNQTASKLIEKALYVMESAFHPLFNFATGKCKLQFRFLENRSFHIAIFRHLNFVAARACYRTALELCKLLLSLDSKDPLGVTLMIDFYALKSNQHAWLLSFYAEWEALGKNLSQLPNFVYSAAIVHFYSENGKSDCKIMGPRLSNLSGDALQHALIMFPSVLLPLLDKCSIEPDERAAKHPFFTSTKSTQSLGLSILCSLYVNRSFHIWKDPDLLSWLEDNVNKVLDRVDSKCDDLVVTCENYRKTRYQGTPREVYRHVAISEIKETMTLLPREIVISPILNYDPLPPNDSIHRYPTNVSQNNIEVNSNNSDIFNSFVSFSRSLLPNYNPSDANRNANEATNQAQSSRTVLQPGEITVNDLRRSLGSVLETMQGLFRRDQEDSELFELIENHSSSDDE